MNRAVSRIDRQHQPLSKGQIEDATRVFEQLINRGQLVRQLHPQPQQLVRLAKRLHAMRQRRAVSFEPQLFGEPSWDILLSLFIAQEEEYRMKVTVVCHESGAAATTALRWVDTLISSGFVRKYINPLDARSRYLELTPDGHEKMRRFLAETWRDYFPFD